MAENEPPEDSCCAWLSQIRGSRRLILLIVAIAILLDNMLLTSVVPIIPSFLFHLSNDAASTKMPEDHTLPRKIISHQHEYQYEERMPYFLRQKPPKTPSKEWDISGITIVPNDVFYKYAVVLSDDKEKGEPTDTSVEISKALTKTRHQKLVDENFEVGFLFASKPFVQAIVNPFIGTICSRVGYSIIMFVGFIILFTSSLAFAIGNTYTTLFMARAVQGVGSSCTSVAGMGTLAEKYPDDAERGNAMAIALGGLALGVLIGPVYGGTLYEFVGKAAPFLILAALAVVDGLLQLMVLQPKVKKQPQEDTPILSLMKDPYIMIAAGAITFSNIGIAVLEPSLPLWMMDTMDASKWQQGAAFLPASISYLIGTNLFGPLGHKMGRWLAAMIGLLVIGVCLICVPLAKSVQELIPANAGIGFAIGMVDSSMMPMLGYLVDIRHTSVYGCVYAIADIAFCLGFIIGPVLSATIVEKLGFEGSVCAVALISFVYAPLLVFLRNPPGKSEIKISQSKGSAKYALYSDDDSFEAEALTKVKEEPTCY